MPKILFMSEAATLAHIVRPLTLARHAYKCGFEVTLASSTNFDSLINEHSLPRIKLNSRTPEKFASILKSGGTLFDEAILSNYVEEDLNIIKQERPDLIVGDLRLSLAVSARIAKIPYMSITNAHWCKNALERIVQFPCIDTTAKYLPNGLIGDIGLTLLNYLNAVMLPGILRAQMSGINKLRARYNQSTYRDYYSSFTDADHILLSDSPDIVHINYAKGNNPYTYIGPINWSPKISLTKEQTRFIESKPYIFINLGSSGNFDKLEEIISGALQTDLNLIIATTGRYSPSGKILDKCKTRALFADYLPGETICKYASLVITNGGTPSTYQALQAGVPVLGIPSNMDQLIFMSCAQSSGVIKSLRSDRAFANTTAQLLHTILSDEVMQSRCRQLQEKINNIDTLKIFYDLATSYTSKQILYASR